MHRLAVILCPVLLAGCFSTGDAAAPDAGLPQAQAAPTHMAQAQPAPSTAPSPRDGVTRVELKPGTGAEAKSGQRVRVHYTGKLTDGKTFDSSVGKAPFTFALGAGQVIKGWDLGVAGMKVGGQRRLTIPPELAYGARGAPPVIPPNSTLVFDVELLAIE